MLACYFFRVALIVTAVLSMVQPARAEYITNTFSCSAQYGSCPSGTLTASILDASCAAQKAAIWPTYNITFYLQSAPSTWACGVQGDASPAMQALAFNASPVGAPACTAPATYNSVTGACDAPACPANGTGFSSGYYDIGTNPNVGSGLPATSGCDGGCSTAYNGDSIGWRVQVGGVYHYFAKGGYFHTGAACSSGSPSVGVLTSIPSVTCAAGQSLVTGSNGFKKCYDDMSGTFVDGNSASAVAAAQTLADAVTASQLAAAGSAVAAAGGSASDVAAAQSVAAGVAAAAAGTNPDPVQAAFCAENPTASICVASDFGSVEDSNLMDKTVNVAITPVSVGGAGSCPAPSAMVLRGQTYYFDWTTYCNFANMIKPILLAFAWLAAAGILVGGFVA